MTDFYSTIEDYLGDSNSLADIRAVIRRLYFYDFNGYPLRVWQGGGRLFTSDGNEWLGSIDTNNIDHHEASALQDGRDGSSATYTFGLTIPDLPGEPASASYDKIKSEQRRVNGRSLTVYLAIFNADEGLRPATPMVFYKQLTMFSPKFAEKIISTDGKTITKSYKATISAKDSNYGRSLRPNGTYADVVQKRRALELGVSLDRGSEFLGLLANHTFKIP